MLVIRERRLSDLNSTKKKKTKQKQIKNEKEGQKQRINIARAFYNESKVLIMDESTNSLDAENEQLIFNDITKIKKHWET